MSETNKKEAGVQEETEKDLPETEPVTEPVEESPEATAGTETTEETESAAEDDKESDKETKGKNSFFGKKKKDNKLEQQIEDLTDRLKRNMAEFDNFRKRTEKEKSSMYVIGAKDIIEKILPVVDNFERGLAQAPEDDPFAEGMQKIYKQFTTTMEGMGVEPIEAVGKEFNPDFHNAVMHVEDESVGDSERIHLQGICSPPQHGKSCKLIVLKEKGSGCEADIYFFWKDKLEYIIILEYIQEEYYHGKNHWY